MEAFVVADTCGDVPELVTRALAGQRVVITRDGRPIAEMRAVQAEGGRRERTPGNEEAVRRLDEMREAIGPLAVSATDVLQGLREERP